MFESNWEYVTTMGQIAHKKLDHQLWSSSLMPYGSLKNKSNHNSRNPNWGQQKSHDVILCL
jgi:hypothetical protein